MPLPAVGVGADAYLVAVIDDGVLVELIIQVTATEGHHLTESSGIQSGTSNSMILFLS